jgi:antitoxin component of MazEF toxin-antitoxin module
VSTVWVHAVNPLAVIICATVLGALHILDGPAVVALIGGAAAVSVPVVARAHSRETDAGNPPGPAGQ